MNIRRQTRQSMPVVLSVLALTGSLSILCAHVPASADERQDARHVGDTQNEAAQKSPTFISRRDTALAGIGVSFKLDPRLTKSLYMGDRWVSPPTYTRVGEGPIVTVEARAMGVDPKGRPRAVQPEWKPDDPGMVSVLPTEGSEVKITVRRAGRSSLRVISQGVSKELVIKASYQDNALLVEIAQRS